jgi:hypothetical protein
MCCSKTDAAGTGNWLFRREGEPVIGAEPLPEIVLDVLRIEVRVVIGRARLSDSLLDVGGDTLTNWSTPSIPSTRRKRAPS